MAVIFRSIFRVADEDSTFTERAPRHALTWLRRKLAKDGVAVPDTVLDVEERQFLNQGLEITTARGTDGPCDVFRLTLFEGERADGVQLRTTFTAIASDEESWSWVDLERWTSGHEVPTWIAAPPGIVSSVLEAERASRGDIELLPNPLEFAGKSGAEAADLVVSEDRDVPIVVVSYRRDEPNGVARAADRAREIAKRVAGVAAVHMLGEGAVSAFSKRMLEMVGGGMDVHSGAIRTYLPGVGLERDFPGRHRFVSLGKLAGRRPDLAARIIAPPVVLRATEVAPPLIWRSVAKQVLESDGEGRDVDAELDELVALETARLDELRDLREDLAEEEDANVVLLRANGKLLRQIEYLQKLTSERDESDSADSSEEEPELVLCADVVAEARRRLGDLVIPDSVEVELDSLDQHGVESWASWAWGGLRALNSYAAAKRDGYDGDFLTFCESESARTGGFPPGKVARGETSQTMARRKFREIRTFPVSSLVDASGQVVMEPHPKLPRRGTLAPRIHFYDDTQGVTGKVHIGYFGLHLDSWAKP